MATKAERSCPSVLHGGDPIPGVEEEAASPLWAHPSENIPLLERALRVILATLGRRLAELEALSQDILAYVAKGRAGVFMGKEFGSAIYAVWIVVSVAIWGWCYRQFDTPWARETAQACSDYCRAWLAFWALTVGWQRPVGVISDADDPPGAARPGPVYATSPRDERWWPSVNPSRDRKPDMVRTPQQLACVAVGERSWQRDHSADENWRLQRPYLDSPGIGQVVEMALGLGWTGDGRVTEVVERDGTRVMAPIGDWHAAILSGLRRHFDVDCILPVSAEDRATISAARNGDRAALRQVVAWLADYPSDYRFRLRRCERGLDLVVFGTGKRSTAPTLASRWEEGEPQGWLAVDGGERQSSGCPDAIKPADVTIVGNAVRAIRSDGKFGAREMALCQSTEVYRIEGGGGEPVRLVWHGQEDSPTAASGAAPAPRPPAVPASPAPGAGAPGAGLDIPMAEDGNPLAYHDLTGLLVGEITTLVSICVGRLTPPATRYAAGVLRELANRLEPPKRH